MTTNQTIDGVPRKLLTNLLAWLERANERNDDGDIAEYVELRALLDAEPSVPSQREPVTMDGKTTIREYVANSIPEDQIGDDWTKGYEECKRRIHRMFQQPVNAEQPAPVASVIDDNVEFEKWWMSTQILRKQKIQIAQEAWFARANLSK